MLEEVTLQGSEHEMQGLCVFGRNLDSTSVTHGAVALFCLAFWAGALYARYVMSSYTSSYVDVVVAWVKLNITHRTVALQVSEWLHVTGVPVQMLPSADLAVCLGSIAAISSGVVRGGKHRLGLKH